MSKGLPAKRGIVSRSFSFLWRFIKVFNTLVFSLVSLVVIAAVLYAVFGQRGLEIPTGAALLLNPAGSLVEQQSELSAVALLQEADRPQQALVKDITDALALARDDSRIGLVVLALDQLESGLLPRLETVAKAIVDFKTSGKKVIAVADNYSQSALFIAAHADEVLLHPEGKGVPEGFAMYQPYFKSFLDKHAVTINSFKVGKYKSASDPYLRDNMSADDRTARMAILDAWWQAYTAGIETARGLTAGTIDAMLQDAPRQVQLVEGDLAQLSLETGLVDRLVTDTEQRRYLMELAGEQKDKKDYRKVVFDEYLQVARVPDQPDGNKVAVITAVGPILDGHAPSGEIGSQSLSALIRKARQDDNVKAIVLRIDSPGGSKTASEVIRGELQVAQSSGIPVVASMGSLAASGGYWIAASADEIWASPTTITGSIGIYGLLPSFEKTLARYGISSDGVATTPIAGGASALRGVSPEYAQIIQSIIEAGYQQFLTTVASGRNMDIDAVHEVAQGRIWTGEKARELKLVDQLGDLDQAISAAARLADTNDYTVWHVESELSFEDRVLRQLTESISTRLPTIRDNPVSRVTGMIQRELGLLSRLNDPRHAYVICNECIVLR